jgi:hypothetical protein
MADKGYYGDLKARFWRNFEKKYIVISQKLQIKLIANENAMKFYWIKFTPKIEFESF